jgi:hypothetical protein
MSSRRILQAPERRRRPVTQRQWSIWDYIFGGYYNGG